MIKSNIVNWERKGDVGILSISNGRENYLSNPDFIPIEELKEWTSEQGLKGIIITGSGRNFSAGADLDNLSELAKDYSILSEKMNEGKAILNFIEELDIPVIAAINGVCFGGGLEIALACHIRVASKKALFAFPEINHGLIPGLGGTYRLTNLIGKKAFEIIMSGDMINANHAQNLGLVNHVSEEKDSFEMAYDLLNSMVGDRSVEVIHSVMKALRNGEKLNREEALNKETELFCRLAVSVKPDRQD